MFVVIIINLVLLLLLLLLTLLKYNVVDYLKDFKVLLNNMHVHLQRMKYKKLERETHIRNQRSNIAVVGDIVNWLLEHPITI